MPVDDTNDPVTPARRMNARRGRGGSGGGFSSGVSTTSESLRTREDGMDDDDIIDADPQEMQRRVIEAGSQTDDDDNGVGDTPNPRQRMNQVAMAGSASYSKEYRLTLLHRMLMRKIPLDQIAAELKVSISTIEKDRVLLKQRLREEARSLNIDEMIGNSLGMYDEIAGMALKVASDTGNVALGRPGQPTAMRLAAMRTALAAKADQTRFLHTAGVFDVLPFRRADDGSDVSDVQRLMERTSEMMERMIGGDDAAPAPRKRVKRTGGFDGFTMDDKDASNSDDEVVDL